MRTEDSDSVIPTFAGIQLRRTLEFLHTWE